MDHAVLAVEANKRFNHFISAFTTILAGLVTCNAQHRHLYSSPLFRKSAVVLAGLSGQWVGAGGLPRRIITILLHIHVQAMCVSLM